MPVILLEFENTDGNGINPVARVVWLDPNPQRNNTRKLARTLIKQDHMVFVDFLSRRIAATEVNCITLEIHPPPA